MVYYRYYRWPVHLHNGDIPEKQAYYRWACREAKLDLSWGWSAYFAERIVD